MAVKLTRLTHKIAIQLHVVWQRAVPFAVLAPGDQSGNFWILTHMFEVISRFLEVINLYAVTYVGFRFYRRVHAECEESV
jgi:hypothetical protein